MASARPDVRAQPAVLAALAQDLAQRRAGARWRSRRVVDGAQGPELVVDGRRVLSFASNDYLGLAADARLVEAACTAARRLGVGAAASHLVSGHAREHDLLEAELAAFCGPCEGARALLFGSGYLANQAILTALCGRDDAIFADKLNHACLNDGALLSRAAFVRYAHGDVQALATRLRATRARRRIIATDAVFSMDGDVAPLRDILMLAHEHDALVVVDDAHGFGVLGEGRGSVAAAGLHDARIVYMGTLGKAAGVAGAFVAAHPTVVETLVQSARAYIYSTAAPPLLAAALRAALAILRDDAPRRARVLEWIAQFRAGAAKLPWRLLDSATPIQPLVVGDERAALALGEALWSQDLFVPVIRPPTVPVGSARLRVSLTAAHTQAHVERLLDALARAAAAS